jgi:hypothetical protein
MIVNMRNWYGRDAAALSTEDLTTNWRFGIVFCLCCQLYVSRRTAKGMLLNSSSIWPYALAISPAYKAWLFRVDFSLLKIPRQGSLRTSKSLSR